MHSARPPWWMFLVAASFVGLLALIPYLVIWGPADPEGLNATFERGLMQIRAVAPNTPLAEAGLKVGDQVLMVGGQPVHNTNDWAAVLANLQVGRVQVWSILRNEKRLDIEVVPDRATWQNRLAYGYVLYVGLTISYFVLGFFVAFRRPGDIVARIGAWFITTVSVEFGLPSGSAVLWRQLPVVVQALLWIPEISVISRSGFGAGRPGAPDAGCGLQARDPRAPVREAAGNPPSGLGLVGPPPASRRDRNGAPRAH